MRSCNIRSKILATAIFVAAALLPAIVLSGSDTGTSDTGSSGMKMGMSMGMPMDAPVVPAVNGYIDGEKMLFIHTETSDPEIARILTDMMGGSPVPVVPSLADAPIGMLAPVYVFTNGYSGMGPMGPLGGQADIFVAAPGQPGYSPLRTVMLVTWNDGSAVSVLTSFEALQSPINWLFSALLSDSRI